MEDYAGAGELTELDDMTAISPRPQHPHDLSNAKETVMGGSTRVVRQPSRAWPVYGAQTAAVVIAVVGIAMVAACGASRTRGRSAQGCTNANTCSPQP